jgi:hypothetical protein
VFDLGFTKIAALDRHSDGTEFKIQDTDPAPYAAGAGGLSPSGIPTYRPIDIMSNKAKPSVKKAIKQTALNIALFGKSANVDPGDVAQAYIGTSGQGADTLVSQLKYETSTDNISQNLGYNQEKTKRRLLSRRKK